MTEELSGEDLHNFMDAGEAMMALLTKRYIGHMEGLLADIENYADMKPADFEYLKDRVLLILSDDDDTFNQENKDALVNIMSAPTVIRDLKGGHLALVVRPDAYVQITADYIEKRTKAI